MSTITTADAKTLIREQLAAFADDPASFPAALAARARMPHRYSVGNMLLILAQSGDRDVLADRIMPRREWAELGYVPAGASCWIWSKPFHGWRTEQGVTFRRDQAPEDAAEFTAFRLVPTYPARAVRDGQGRTAEQESQPLTGEPAQLYTILRAWLATQGWTIEERLVDRAGGWTDHDARLIRIDPRFLGWDRVRVLVHEAAHALMHDGDARPYAGEHRGDMEAEADGVAFAVLSAYGQTEAAARTVAYVAGWARSDVARIEAAMERAAAALDAIMGALAGEAVALRAPKTAKADNRALAAWLREHDLPANGPVWSAAKAGERDLGVLAGLTQVAA